MIPLVRLHRTWQDRNQSLSTMSLFLGAQLNMTSVALERGWRNNEIGVSCLPADTYTVVLEWSEKFQKMLWEIKGTEPREECKFHAANFWRQINGCVALGRTLADIDGDGYLDVTSSKDTMEDFHRLLDGFTEFQLIITTEENIF